MDPDIGQLATALEILNLEGILMVVIGFAVIVGAARLVRKVSDQLQATWPARRLLFLQLATIVNFSLYICGGTFLIYAALSPPKEVLLAVAGSAAVAIGFSMKDIVASVVAGVILLFDRPFQVGDRVSFSGTYGEIIGIGLRTVKLVTLDDNLVTIPNSRFLTDVVASGNAGALDMMVVVDFHAALNTDLDEARAIIREVVATSRYVYLKKPVVVLTTEIAVAERLAIRLRAKAYVLDCRFEKAFETDVVIRVTRLFLEKGIERPARA